MTLRFEPILAEGIAQISYLIGDDSARVAAVVDPRRDVDVYLKRAKQLGVSITHVFETHIHADFLSGAHELAARLGKAEIYVSTEGEASYGFEHKSVRNGDRFEFGKVVLTARFTPGHTPEHVSYLVAERDRTDDPFGVLSGDSLFVDSVGRPDLLGEEAAERLVEQLYETMRDVYLAMDDHVIVYPCHGAGSACGPDIGDRLASTIGYERRHNPYLQCESFDAFKQLILGGSPPAPRNYPRLKKINAKGPELLGTGPVVPALPPAEFKAAVERGGATLLDTRHMLAFGGGHIPGALNISASEDILSVWAGWMLGAERPILLVLEDDDRLDQVVRLLVRTGYARFAGYLAGGMTAWDNAGLEIHKLPQISVHELKASLDDLQVVDVRGRDEWEGGHVPGAVHCFVPELADRMDSLDRRRPVATYCNSGYRASIAASLLQANGFEHVCNVPGSWQAWTSAGYSVQGR